MTRSHIPRLLTAALLLFVSTAAVLTAQEARNAAEREKAELKQRITEALGKQRRGEPLTREELELIERVRQKANLGGRRALKRGREREVFIGLGGLNVIDRALFSIAEVLHEKGQYEDAITELKKVAQETPDELAQSAAHLTAGNIYYVNLGNVDEALAEYKQVRGPLAEMARDKIVACCLEADKPADAVAVMEEAFAQAQEPMEKAGLLFRIAEIHRRSGDLDQAIEAYRRVPRVITYEQAIGPQMPPDAEFREKIEKLRAAGRLEQAERLERMMIERRKEPEPPRREWELKPKKKQPPKQPPKE